MTAQELGERIIALTPTLYRVSCGLLPCEADREDAVQSAVEKAWSRALRLRDPEKLRPWLIRVLINECNDVGRRRRREVVTDALPEREAEAEDCDLREALLSLPERERMPLVLHYIEGFSIAEIASSLGCPLGTVLSRMDRGRRLLRERLGGGDFT